MGMFAANQHLSTIEQFKHVLICSLNLDLFVYGKQKSNIEVVNIMLFWKIMYLLFTKNEKGAAIIL